VQAGLVKFQIMGKIFDKAPMYKTVNTMKLYYPAWYMDTVIQYKDKVNPYLIMALIRQESAFNTRAHSAAGARGLMQLLPGTARSFGRVKKHELFTPEKNIASGVRFFAHLMERYNNQVPLALAAYNAGPLNVDDWVKRYPTDNPLLFIDIIPFRETREYVSSILRNWYWYNKLYAETYPTQSNKNDPLARALSSTSGSAP
jgi:soluble lytic murein transglycosylase